MDDEINGRWPIRVIVPRQKSLEAYEGSQVATNKLALAVPW